MIPAKKGQTALEYLLIIVVAIIIVVVIYLWVYSTQEETVTRGNEQLGRFFNVTSGGSGGTLPCTDAGYSCYDISACPAGTGYPAGDSECTPEVCCDAISAVDSGTADFIFDSDFDFFGTASYDRAFCFGGGCPPSCPGGDCSLYSGYVLKFTSGDLGGQSYLIQSVIPLPPVTSQFVLLGFDDPNIIPPAEFRPGPWDFDIYG